MMTLLLCLCLQDDPAAVIETMTARLKDNPADTGSWLARAAAQLALEKWQAAFQDASEALRLNPAQGATYRLRARARIALKEADGAISDLSRAIELDPQDELSWVQRCRAYASIGDARAAARDAERALAINADLAELVAIAKKGEDPEKPLSIEQRVAAALKSKTFVHLGEDAIDVLKREKSDLAREALKRIDGTVKAVEEQAARLEREDVEERDAATAAIVKLGRCALPTLKRLAGVAKGESKARLEEIAKKLAAAKR
jgi:tetratricopeptide (TPR) repeat protein